MDRSADSARPALPTLRTERLALDPYTPEDEENFVALFQDQRVSRWIGDGPATEAENRALFHRIFPIYDERRFDVWAVRRIGADGAPAEFIGHAEIKPTDTVSGHEIVYALAPAAWGAGLGTELAEALVSYGFVALKLPVVYATVAAANEASLKVLKRLGFERVRDITEDDGGVVVVLAREP